MLLLVWTVLPFSAVKAETVTVRLDSLSVKNWNQTFVYVWTGSTSPYDAYQQKGNTTRILWAEMTESDGNGYYTASFEADEETVYHVGWYYQTGYPSSSYCVTNVIGSVCCEYNSSMTVVDYVDIPTETVTIRLDPFSITWSNVYAYAWRGTGNHSNYSRRTRELIWAEKAEMDEEGWYSVSFKIDTGAAYGFGWGYGNSNYSYSLQNLIETGKVCFTLSGSTLEKASCASMLPTDETTFTVHVVTAGTLGQLLLAQINQWTDIYALTITGTLNDEDMALFGYMKHLQRLDLSGTDITTITGCANLSRLKDVVLPTTCTTVADNAFYYCIRLRNINLDHILQIGQKAFCMDSDPNTYYSQYSGSSLISVDMPLVQTIDDYAFSSQRGMTECTMPQVQSIGSYAFSDCPDLTEIAIPKITSLGSTAFYAKNTNGKLQSVLLSDELETIPQSCFYGHPLLQSIHFPTALKTIGSGALPSLSGTVILPEGVKTVESGNFDKAEVVSIPSSIKQFTCFSSSWKEIRCYAVDPTFSHSFANQTLSGITLYVPSAALAAYKLSTVFHNFKQILPLDTTVSTMDIHSEMMLLSKEGISDDAQLNLLAKAGLTVSIDTPFAIGEYNQYVSTFNSEYRKYNNGYLWYASTSCTGMLLTQSPMTTEAAVIRLVPRANRWNFFSLPFDVKMKDITLEADGISQKGTSQWVIREYSGANRAAGVGDTWVNVPADGTLSAYKGYILYWTVSGGNSYNNNSSNTSSEPSFTSIYWFRMPAANSSRQNLFATDDVTIPLTEYPAASFHNRSWNLVGNPYPCAFSTREMDYFAPITTWNGKQYVAYSLVDDDYVLRPAEAFFVQAPVGTTALTFRKSGRTVKHTREISQAEYNNYYNAPARRQDAPADRQVYNFYLSQKDFTDRARIVLNEEAAAEYDIHCDAAKMFSSDNTISQLFVNEGGVYYAIDERPSENGQCTLGAWFAAADEYTLHLDMPDNTTDAVILYDTETGARTDLTTDTYRFTAEAGMADTRFLISFVRPVPTAVEQSIAPASPVKVMRNGQLIICMPDGKRYTTEGTEL